MNGWSHKICKACRDLNKDGEVVAYSIDAGFHVFLFTMKENVEMVEERIKQDVSEGLERIIHTKIGEHGTIII